MRKSVLILGGGISGCSAAYLLRKAGYEVRLIEQEDELGGMCATRAIQGIHYEFGPHICYAADATPAYQIFHDLLPEFKPIRYFPKQSMDGELNNLATFPITVANVLKLPEQAKVKAIEELYHVNLDEPDYANFEAYIISRVGKTMYEYCYKNYNRKQWGIEPEKMDSEWARFRNFYLRSGDYGMFGDMWQGHPGDYNAFFRRLMGGVEVIHDTVESVEYLGDRVSAVRTSRGEYRADVIVSTLPVDFILNQKDLLNYRGIVKLFYCLKGPSGLPTYLCTFPNHYPWTRITDYVLQAEQDTEDSLISFAVPFSSREEHLPVEKWKAEAETFVRDKLKKEIIASEAEAHRYVYPISSKAELDRYRELIGRAAGVRNLVTFGRLGLYSYISMCTAINQAADIAANFESVLGMEKDARVEYYARLRERLS